MSGLEYLGKAYRRIPYLYTPADHAGGHRESTSVEERFIDLGSECARKVRLEVLNSRLVGIAESGFLSFGRPKPFVVVTPTLTHFVALSPKAGPSHALSKRLDFGMGPLRVRIGSSDSCDDTMCA